MKKGHPPDLNRVGGGKMLLHQHMAKPCQTSQSDQFKNNVVNLDVQRS